MMILLEDMTDACRLKQHEHDCAYTFAGLVFCISGYLSIWSLTKFTLKLPLKTDDYTMMIEGISFLLFLEILLFTSLSLRDIGLIPKRGMFQKSLKETLLLAAGACLVLLSAKVILTLCGAPIKEKFIGGSIAGMTNYMITATVQEFLARGVIQTCIKSLMQVRYQKTFGVILTSLLFSIMHLPFGFIFMMGSLLLSLVLGYIFERHQHMWGCAFLHWSCGYLAMCLFF